MGWDLIKHFSPGKEYLVFESMCRECCVQEQIQEQKNFARQREELEKKEYRKSLMAELVYMSKRKAYPSIRIPPELGTWNLIPATWASKLSLYSKDQSDDLPGPIDTHNLLCPHERLLYTALPPISYFKNTDNNSLPCTDTGIMCEIPPHEWTVISERYGATAPAIQLSVSVDSDNEEDYEGMSQGARKKFVRKWANLKVDVCPKVCEQCCLDRYELEMRSSLEDAVVYIEELDESAETDQNNGRRSRRSSKSRELIQFPLENINMTMSVKEFSTLIIDRVSLSCSCSDMSLSIYSRPTSAFLILNMDSQLCEFVKPEGTIYISLERNGFDLDLDVDGIEEVEGNSQKKHIKTPPSTSAAIDCIDLDQQSEEDSYFEEGFIVTNLYKLTHGTKPQTKQKPENELGKQEWIVCESSQDLTQ